MRTTILIIAFASLLSSEEIPSPKPPLSVSPSHKSSFWRAVAELHKANAAAHKATDKLQAVLLEISLTDCKEGEVKQGEDGEPMCEVKKGKNPDSKPE